MPKYDRHIFVCENSRATDHPRGSCDPNRDETLRDRFKQEVRARGLRSTVRANRAGCLDQCEHGPVVVVYPEAVWYGGVTLEDVPEIMESHIQGGNPVRRLLIPDGCLNNPDCPHRRRGERGEEPSRAQKEQQDAKN